MDKKHINESICFYQELCDELYVIDTIVSMTKSSCLEREFNGEYYGTTGECSAQLSAERNNYINMLTILSEKISNMINLNCAAETEFLLQKNANNSRRQITTESTANQCS